MDNLAGGPASLKLTYAISLLITTVSSAGNHSWLFLQHTNQWGGGGFSLVSVYVKYGHYLGCLAAYQITIGDDTATNSIHCYWYK